MKSLFERNHCTNQPRWRWNGCDSWTSCLIDVCVSSCLWPTAGETVLAEGQSGTRAYVWHTLSLTVEVSKGLFFTSWTEPTYANILHAGSQAFCCGSLQTVWRSFNGVIVAVWWDKSHSSSLYSFCCVLPVAAKHISASDPNKVAVCEKPH